MEGWGGGDKEDDKDEAQQREQEETTSEQPGRRQFLNSDLWKLIIKNADFERWSFIYLFKSTSFQESTGTALFTFMLLYK